MSTLLISYDLRRVGRDYDAIHEAIQKLGILFCHRFLESVWIIDTFFSLDYVAAALRRVVDWNDGFLVVDITNKPGLTFNTLGEMDG